MNDCFICDLMSCCKKINCYKCRMFRKCDYCIKKDIGLCKYWIIEGEEDKSF